MKAGGTKRWEREDRGGGGGKGGKGKWKEEMGRKRWDERGGEKKDFMICAIETPDFKMNIRSEVHSCCFLATMHL